jgi:hypothetical protein
MKAVLLVCLSTLFLSGCVYTHPSPYGYSSYRVVTPTPVYPRYEAPRYYTPAPAPRYRSFDDYPHSHHHSRRYW